jgi:hypothetical protein
MKQKDQNTETNRPTSKSSIAVSRKIVCEDEACIGKEVKVYDLSSTNQAEDNKQNRKSPGTIISIGGKEACSDDACIGRK